MGARLRLTVSGSVRSWVQLLVSLFLSPISVVEFYLEIDSRNNSNKSEIYLQTIFFSSRFLSRNIRQHVKGRKRNKAQEKRNQRDMNTIARFEKSQGLKMYFLTFFFFISSRRFSFIIDALWPTFSYFFFFRFPNPCSTRKKRFAQGFTVNRSYVIKASLWIFVSVCCPQHFISIRVSLHASSLWVPNLKSTVVAMETVTCGSRIVARGKEVERRKMNGNMTWRWKFEDARLDLFMANLNWHHPH